MSDTWTIYTDGGSRGNPGPAAYAYVIKRPGQPDIEEKAYLGQTTNNIAEYNGMVEALKHAKEIGGKNLVINSDSELMVKQMNGQYKVKHAGLIPLYQQAVALRKHFESVKFKHVYRDQNAQADALCNEAMDDRAPAPPNRVGACAELGVGEPSRVSGRVEAPTTSGATPLMKALALLKQSAARWAEGDATDPPPAQVLNQLIEILQAEAGPPAD